MSNINKTGFKSDKNKTSQENIDLWKKTKEFESRLVKKLEIHLI